MAMATHTGVAASKVLILVGAGRNPLPSPPPPNLSISDWTPSKFELAATFDPKIVILCRCRPDGIDRPAEWTLVRCIGGAPGPWIFQLIFC
jgi:hypothetical protein